MSFFIDNDGDRYFGTAEEALGYVVAALNEEQTREVAEGMIAMLSGRNHNNEVRLVIEREGRSVRVVLCCGDEEKRWFWEE
jgi:hypothetical protein